MRFHDPAWLWFILAAPAIAALGLHGVNRSAAALRRVVSGRLVPAGSFSSARRGVLLLSASLALLAFALARPQYGVKPVQVTRSGVDIMIMLDTSKSMAAEDVRPSRMERAKNEAARLIDALEGNRMGLIAFAGASFVEIPLTLDAGAARLILDGMGVGSIPVPGTAIGEALRAALKAFETSKARTKAVILITDGENLEDDALEAAREAAEAGLTVFTVGVGSEAGAPVPQIGQTGEAAGYKKDKDGRIIMTRLDSETLREIAAIGGGDFYRAGGGGQGLSALVERLERMEKTDITSQEFTEYEERYQPFVLAALALLALEGALSRRSSRSIRAPRV
ncbi:MAG: VWA domain-containing protein [Candidatus Nitrospinota bacterium M3_3B_026]